MSYAGIIIPFIGGLGMFIYGMQIMAQGLENAAGSKMKSLLEALTRNKLMGVLLGALITAVIQSSSATTVMVVGFVNAGIMNLSQAMGVIMGAKYRNDSDRMAGIQCRVGEVFKSVEPCSDRNYVRCHYHADRKPSFYERLIQHHHRVRLIICRNYNDVGGGRSVKGVRDVQESVCDALT